jgi:hypothetical protein
MSSDRKSDEPYDEQRRAVLEQLFAEQPAGNANPAALDEMRARFTVSVADGSKGAAERFDSLAYSAELRHQLIESQTLSEEDLAALANQRAEGVRDAIVSRDPELQGRIVIGEVEKDSTKVEGNIRVKVRLTADDAKGATQVPEARKE